MRQPPKKATFKKLQASTFTKRVRPVSNTVQAIFSLKAQFGLRQDGFSKEALCVDCCFYNPLLKEESPPHRGPRFTFPQAQANTDPMEFLFGYYS